MELWSGRRRLYAETINEQVLAQADAAYQSMDTYQSQGKIISEINAGGKEMTTDTTFTVLLKKPNLYLVTWSQKIPGMPDVQTGAVWHDGARRYLYMSGVKAYCPMPDDASAGRGNRHFKRRRRHSPLFLSDTARHGGGLLLASEQS